VLPQIHEGNEVAGRITSDAARRTGLREGTPMVTGVVDGSAGMLAAGARIGQLMNVSGSTDVLALCTNRPHPHERLLTRALGVRGLWLAVYTIAAAGSSLDWARAQLFGDVTEDAFWRQVGRLARRGRADEPAVRFEPYLAGDRMNIQQRRGAFAGLSLATTRTDMLQAIIESLAKASAARVPILQESGVRILRQVVVTGGVQRALSQLLHRDWPGRWRFRTIQNATVRGLGELAPAR
jgi:xylulokinase